MNNNAAHSSRRVSAWRPSSWCSSPSPTSTSAGTTTTEENPPTTPKTMSRVKRSLAEPGRELNRNIVGLIFISRFYWDSVAYLNCPFLNWLLVLHCIGNFKPKLKCFFKLKLNPKFVLLNCHPGCGVRARDTQDGGGWCRHGREEYELGHRERVGIVAEQWPVRRRSLVSVDERAQDAGEGLDQDQGSVQQSSRLSVLQFAETAPFHIHLHFNFQLWIFKMFKMGFEWGMTVFLIWPTICKLKCRNTNQDGKWDCWSLCRSRTTNPRREGTPHRRGAGQISWFIGQQDCLRCQHSEKNKCHTQGKASQITF